MALFPLRSSKEYICYERLHLYNMYGGWHFVAVCCSRSITNIHSVDITYSQTCQAISMMMITTTTRKLGAHFHCATMCDVDGILCDNKCDNLVQYHIIAFIDSVHRICCHTAYTYTHTWGCRWVPMMLMLMMRIVCSRADDCKAHCYDNFIARRCNVRTSQLNLFVISFVTSSERY